MVPSDAAGPAAREAAAPRGRAGGGVARADIEAAADVLRALAYPVRLLVVVRLLDGEADPAELAALAGVDGSVLSHHLRHLRQAGMVQRRRDRGRVMYRSSGEVSGLLDAVMAYVAPGRSGRAAERTPAASE